MGAKRGMFVTLIPAWENDEIIYSTLGISDLKG